MDLLNIMAKRRSVRKYRNEPLKPEELDSILTAALLAPTSMNRKPCSFYAVTDREVLAQLAGIKKAGGAFVKDAAAAVVVFGDEAKADTWLEDTSIALSFMMLEAQSLSIGSCWVQVYLRKGADESDAEENLRKIFGVPSSYRISGILSLGYPADDPKAYNIDALDRSPVKLI